ncbi:MAG: hypothetical protein RJA26_548 [Actinomycetota bacterium]
MYLYQTAGVRIFAHRGLAIAADGSPIDENTLPAFARALEVGADYIEADLQLSKDGVPVIFHDDNLARVAGVDSPVYKLTLEELKALKLEHGGTIATLAEALEAFPKARFNLDFKTVGSITAGTKVIAEHGAQGRVLVASFSDARGEAAASKLPGVARSAGGFRTLRAALAQKLGGGILLGMALTGVSALQIPTHQGRLRLDTSRFIRQVQKHGVEVHYWTINDTEEMKRLVALGANGIVTDRADLAVAALRS